MRWLSRGKVLQRVFELRREMAEFMKEEKPELARFFTEPECVAKLAYLVDIFDVKTASTSPSKEATHLFLQSATKSLPS